MGKKKSKVAKSQAKKTAKKVASRSATSKNAAGTSSKTKVNKSASKATRKTTAKRSSSKPQWAQPRFKDKVFAVTGTFDSKQLSTKTKVNKYLKAEGAIVKTTVTAAVDYLLVGETRGSGKSSAETKAAALNSSGKASIAVIDEDQFRRLLLPDREEALAMLRAGNKGVKCWNTLVDHDSHHYYYRSSTSTITGHEIDLTHADFRGVDLSSAVLTIANLDGADFTGADLTHKKGQQTSTTIGKINGATFDKAKLAHTEIEEATGCSFQNADISSLRGDFKQCNFDGALGSSGYFSINQCTMRNAKLEHIYLGNANGADLTGSTIKHFSCHYSTADGIILKDCKLKGADLAGSDFKKADFSGADLTDAEMNDSNFTEAVFKGANMSNASLAEANLTKADLSKANLTRVELSAATLKDANVTGADFNGVLLNGVKLDNVDLSKAKNVTQPNTSAGKLGANLKELDKIAKKAQQLKHELTVDMPDGRCVELSITTYNGNYNYGSEQVTDNKNTNTRWNNHNDPRLSGVMLHYGQKWVGGELRLNDIKVKSQKSPTGGKALREIVIAGWCEAFGVDIPSADDLKKLKESAAEDAAGWIEDLKSTAKGKGVAGWNKIWRGQDSSKRSHRFRKADLAGLNLQSIDMGGLDFDGCVFKGANMQKARLGNGKFKKVDFSGCDMTNAKMSGAGFLDAKFDNAKLTKAAIRNARLQRASFTNADLSNAAMHYSDLRGTDLSSATLAGVTFDHAKFDEKTVFPKGFEIPEKMEWAGAGLDPRAAEKVALIKAEGPIDIDTFMERVEASVDKKRLQKSLKMLKAASFQLFSDTSETELVGVVKSQTDANLLYACRLNTEGEFSCCTQNLNTCGGLRGALCKHLLVLIIGLAKAGEIDPTTVDEWIARSKFQKPELDRDLMGDVFLKYKGAEAGELDWRPTETVPEDYYAF